MRAAMIALAVLCAVSASAAAGEADVTAVEARETPSGWTFRVTVRHGDTGWDHYADAWRVVAPDGTVLGTRELLHPHVEDQPFTRSLSGVVVPEGASTVRIEAHDSVHGWGGKALGLDLATGATRTAGD